MARKPSNYWEKRATQLMKDLEAGTQHTINDLIEIYEQATKNINKEIENIFKNYAKYTNLNKEALTSLLNKKETKKHYENILKVINSDIVSDEVKQKLLTKYNAPAYSYRISRLQAIQDNIDVELNKLAELEQQITKSRYVKTIDEAYHRNIYNIQSNIGMGFSFSNLDMKTVNLLLASRWVDNKNFSQRIWGNIDKLNRYLKINLTANMLTGKSVNKISKELSEYMNVGMYNATTLVRTEVNHFANEATALSYEECEVEKYEFIATLDSRTCDKCGSLDNQKFNLKDKSTGVNYPPMHPNDRCTTVPCIEDEIVEGLQRRARDPVTGKTYLVDANMNYEEWRKSIDKKYGEGAFAKYQKMNRNTNYDKQQYSNYKDVIGKENLPTTFEKYQDMKYNNSSEYSLMKVYYKSFVENSLPSDMTYAIYKNNLTTDKWQAVGFNPNYVESHKKHLKEFNDISFEEYEKKAKELLNSNDDNILSIISKEGTRFKYSVNNNEFACARPNGITQTYFKPKDGIEYWKREVLSKYGKD